MDWLKHMRHLPLRAGVSMIHISGEEWSKRVTREYNPNVGNWICNVGGTTANYRVDLGEDSGLEYALELCGDLGGPFDKESALVDIAKFLSEHRHRLSYHPGSYTSKYKSYDSDKRISAIDFYFGRNE